MGLEGAAASRLYRQEFHEDVIRVAQSRELGVTIERGAKDLGMHQTTLQSGRVRLMSRTVTSRSCPRIRPGSVKAQALQSAVGAGK